MACALHFSSKEFPSLRLIVDFESKLVSAVFGANGSEKETYNFV